MSKKVLNKNNRNFIPTADNSYTTKKSKLKWSFWVVLALMIFWSVGAVLGIFATARSCNDSASVKIVSAAEISVTAPLKDSFVYNGEEYFTFNLKGSGVPVSYFQSNLDLTCEYNFTNFNCIYVISRNGLIPGNFTMQSIKTVNNRPVATNYPLTLRTTDNPFDNGYQVYTFSNGSFDCNRFINLVSTSYFEVYDFDLTFIITSQTPFNLQIPVLYENGFLDNMYQGSTSLTDKDSMGFFQGGTFKGSLIDPSTNEDYSSWSILPASLIKGYYSGVLMSFYGDEIDYYITNKPDTIYARYVVCDFGINGKQLGGFSNFMVVLKQGNSFSSTGEYGSSVTFRFLDNSQLTFNTADDYFSFIDLSSYQSKKVRSVIWRVARDDIQFMGLTSNQSVIVGYNQGYDSGVNAGYEKGYSVGLSDGKSIGYNQGASSANKYTFLGLFGAVIDAPITAISGLLNFNLLGFNMLNFFYALCTCALVIAVVRLFI